MNGKIGIISVLLFVAFAVSFVSAMGPPTGIVGITITSTTQIAVYTSAGPGDSQLNFSSTAPVAVIGTNLSTDNAGYMDGGKTGFTVENTGNDDVSVAVQTDNDASTFVTGTGPLFQFWGADLDSGCVGALTTTNTDLIEAKDTVVCSDLNYTDGADSIYTYLFVHIPSDAIPGTRSATLTFTATPI